MALSAGMPCGIAAQPFGSAGDKFCRSPWFVVWNNPAALLPGIDIRPMARGGLVFELSGYFH
jgi:hypothetical protein